MDKTGWTNIDLIPQLKKALRKHKKPSNARDLSVCGDGDQEGKIRYF